MTTRPAQTLIIAGAACAAIAITATLDVRAAQMKLASEGIYTAAQATRGRDLYDSQCASCHELGKFKGTEFSRAWTDKPLSDLHTALKSMPMDNPGSLKAPEYAELLAYFLSINDYPAGETELSGEDAAVGAVTVDVKKP